MRYGQTRRELLKLGSAAALVVSPAVLRAQTAPAPGGALQPGKLTVVQNGNAGSNGPFLNSLKDFEAKNPGVTVQVVFLPEPNWVQYMATLQIRLAGGTRYDVVYLAAETQRTFAKKGIVQALNSFIDKDKAYVEEYYADLSPRLLKFFREREDIDGKTFFLPHAHNVMGVYYNKKTLADNGIAAPKPDWSWEEFYQIATLLKKKNIYAFNSNTELFTGVCPWVLTNGGRVLSDDWTRSYMSSEPVIEAARFARSLVADGMAPSPSGTFDQNTALLNGKLAMLGGGVWVSLSLIKNYNDIGILPWPRKVANGSPIGMGAYGMLQNAERPDLAWAFIKWMISKETQVEQIHAAGKQPLRTTSLNDPAYLKKLPEGGHFLGDSLAYAELVPGPEAAPAVGAAVQTSWTQILSGNVKPDVGLKALHEQIQPLL